MAVVTVANSQSLDECKEFIRDLYLTHDLQLKDVRQQLLVLFSLEARYGNMRTNFRSTDDTLTQYSEHQLKRKFKKWGIGKNQKGEQWSKIAKTLKHRQLDTGQASIIANGMLVDAARAKRAIRRHYLPKMEAKRANENIPPRTPEGITISRKLINPTAITTINLPCHLFWEDMRKVGSYCAVIASWTPSNTQIASFDPFFQHFDEVHLNGPMYLPNAAQLFPDHASVSNSTCGPTSTVVDLWTRTEQMAHVIMRELASRKSSAKIPGPSPSMTQFTTTLPERNNFIEDMRLVSYYPGSMVLPVLLSYMVFLCSNHLVEQEAWDNLADNLLDEYGLEALNYPCRGRLSYLKCFSEYILLYAARKGRYEIVRLSRQCFPDLDRRLSHLGPPRTLLQEAIGHKQTSFCYDLLKDGVDLGYPTRPVRIEGWLGDRPAMDLAAYFIPELFHHMLELARQEATFAPELLLPLAVKSGLNGCACLDLLIAGADINAIDSQGGTALQHAISSGDLFLVRHLLDHRASTTDFVEEQRATFNADSSFRSNHATPLFLAVQFNEMRVCEMLIAAGADVNACSPRQHFNLLNVEYQHKSSAEISRGLFQTALQCAIWDNNLDLSKVLVTHGAKFTVSNTIPCLTIAAWRGNCKAIELLLQCGAHVRETCHGGWLGKGDALAYASYNGELETLHIFLTAGTGIDPPEDKLGERWTALQVACSGGNSAAAKWLLHHGANINAPCESESGMTALQAATQCGNKELIELLLTLGADINAAPSRHGYTTLSAAVEVGSMMLVRRLMRRGADVTFNGWHGQHPGSIPLVAAASCGRIDFIEEMVEAGLNLYALIYPHTTILVEALSHAAEYGEFEVINWFLQLGVTISPSDLSRILFCVYRLDDIDRKAAKELAVNLIDRGADINALHLGEHGTRSLTILSRVCALPEDLELVQLLLDRGANVNPDKTVSGRERNCEAPLGRAVSEGHVAIVRLLLQHGADVNSTAASSNWTTLQHAAFRGYIHIAQLLLAAGADVGAVSSRGNLTALYLAVRNGRLDMVKLLLDNYQLKVGESMSSICKEYAEQARAMCLWAVLELLDSYQREEQLSTIPVGEAIDPQEAGTNPTDPITIIEEDINQENIDFNPWMSPSQTSWEV
ncbi:hypothetical protein RBB50_004255 [Rhinocladiella similis]